MTIRGLTVYERVMLRAERTDTGCLVFKGATRFGGYGVLAAGVREFPDNPHAMVSAHRVVFEHHNGAIPKGMFILHSCDNPPCVEISHLRLGTPLDNSRDMLEKGRWRYGPPAVPQSGERNGRAALTWAAVNEIRSSDLSRNALARKFGISARQVRRILNRECWA